MTRQMSKPSARVLCLILTLFAAAIFLWPAPRAEALFPLAYNWNCTSRNCWFTVTTTNHGAYRPVGPAGRTGELG